MLRTGNGVTSNGLVEMKERQRWRPEEDSLLLAYVKQYGPKEWSLIPQRMGKPLDRDPKSCLERWKNYLKPGLKKGSLTPEEQGLVISLQAKYGNKWKKIAAEIPGRTAKRLGKWWEVFKENQAKQLQKTRKRQGFHDGATLSGGGSPETAVQGKYDHILETFAEKYVQPITLYGCTFQSSLPLPPPISPPPPVLSLGAGEPTATGAPSPVLLPPWMNYTIPSAPASSSSSTSSSTPALQSPPSVISLNLSTPPEPLQHQQICTLIQYCKELEEGRQNWVQHRKEATWRMNRVEQQLEAEKARKRREKMEEIETRVRCLREEEDGFYGRIENEYREQVIAVQRDGEAKEAKLMEALSKQHGRLAKVVEQIGLW
ncbi:unnamed protein product [Cuscuta epithymum]|uniref:Uncharacterized protein n=1 Tax=Cuscuta epithymum TaxID=186058 RepID=A0AAV0FNV7_9ASTE|nr:unnamed protein product [Cuscuta epithymum]